MELNPCCGNKNAGKQIMTLDKKLTDWLQNMILTERVSVYSDPDGSYKEYSVISKHGSLLTMTCWTFDKNSKMPCTGYIIEFDDILIKNVQIPRARNIYTPDEQIVLNLFKLCSNKILCQESQNLFFQTMHKSNTKIRKS